jgi:hypothetical protein
VPRATTRNVISLFQFLVLVLVLASSGCAATPWPDEPGVPVALSQAQNVQAADTFLAALTARRRAGNLAAPVVTPRHQSDIRVFAEDLQAGKMSAPTALLTIERWGKVAYQRQVKGWVLDCGAGADMKIPDDLVEMPSAVISYAAAHFRPSSKPNDQCAILVVAVTGPGERVVQQNM